jgi:carboxylesterase type B
MLHLQGAACHSAEIPFVFHSDAFVPLEGSFDSAEEELSWGMLTYWRNFAHGSIQSNKFGPAWPIYNATVQESLDLSIPQITTMQKYHFNEVSS